MGLKAAQSFIAEVEKDKALNASVMDAIKTKSKTVHDVAKENGFDFTEDEYKQVLKDKYGDHLTEEQLNTIAAGSDCCCCCCPASCC